MLFKQRFDLVSAQQCRQAGVVRVDELAQSCGGRKRTFRDLRFYAELCFEVFRLQCKGVHQISHIQHFGCCARDGFSHMARVEVHQTDAGIFYLG